jgi:hypothetical protein
MTTSDPKYDDWRLRRGAELMQRIVRDALELRRLEQEYRKVRNRKTPKHGERKHGQ